jgi:hypothetical protein
MLRSSLKFSQVETLGIRNVIPLILMRIETLEVLSSNSLKRLLKFSGELACSFNLTNIVCGQHSQSSNSAVSTHIF